MKKLFIIIVFLVVLISFDFGNSEPFKFIDKISKDIEVPIELQISAWARLENLDKCFELIQNAESPNRHHFLSIVIKDTPRINKIRLNKFIELVAFVPDSRDQLRHFLQLIRKDNIELLDHAEISLLYEKSNIALNRFADEKEEYLYNLIDLNKAICKVKNFQNEYKRNLVEIEERISSLQNDISRLEVLEYLIFTDIESGGIDYVTRHISMIKRIDVSKAEAALLDNLIAILLAAEQYDDAFKVVFEVAKKSNFNTLLRNQSTLFWDLFFRIGKNEFSDQIVENVNKDRFVQLLIQNFLLKNARLFASHENEWPIVNDRILFHLGQLLVERSQSRARKILAYWVAERIENESLKNQLLASAAEGLIRMNIVDVDDNIVRQIASRFQKCNFISPAWMKSVTDIWFRLEEFDKALIEIERVASSDERDFYYLLAAEQFVLHGNRKQVDLILSKVTSDIARGCIVGMLGSITICQGKIEEGELLFLKAFSLIKGKSSERNGGMCDFNTILPVLVDYYVNARKKGLFFERLKKRLD